MAKTVLVVDDDPSILRAVDTYLRMKGLKVIHVPSTRRMPIKSPRAKNRSDYFRCGHARHGWVYAAARP